MVSSHLVVTSKHELPVTQQTKRRAQSNVFFVGSQGKLQLPTCNAFTNKETIEKLVHTTEKGEPLSIHVVPSEVRVETMPLVYLEKNRSSLLVFRS